MAISYLAKEKIKKYRHAARIDGEVMVEAALRDPVAFEWRIREAEKTVYKLFDQGSVCESGLQMLTMFRAMFERLCEERR